MFIYDLFCRKLQFSSAYFKRAGFCDWTWCSSICLSKGTWSVSNILINLHIHSSCLSSLQTSLQCVSLPQPARLHYGARQMLRGQCMYVTGFDWECNIKQSKQVAVGCTRRGDCWRQHEWTGVVTLELKKEIKHKQEVVEEEGQSAPLIQPAPHDAKIRSWSLGAAQWLPNAYRLLEKETKNKQNFTVNSQVNCEGVWWVFESKVSVDACAAIKLQRHSVESICIQQIHLLHIAIPDGWRLN